MGTNDTNTQTSPSQNDATQRGLPADYSGNQSDQVNQTIQWLSGLFNQAQNANTGNNSDSSQSQPQLPPAHQAAVDGAVQGIKKAAAAAAAQGGLPAANHIINNAMSSVQGGNSPMSGSSVIPQFTPEQIQTLQGLTNPGSQQSNTNTSQSITPQQQNVNEIGQQATNMVTPQQGNHPLGTLLNLIGNYTGINQINSAAQGMQLKNLGKAQTIASGKPAEIALPAAQAATEQAKLKAGGPEADVNLVKQQTTALQQEWQNKAKEINAGIYATQNERQNKLRENLINVRKQVLDQMQADLEHGPVLNKGKRLEIYRQQLDGYDKKLQGMGNTGKYISTGTGPDGKRYGKNADGSVEEITDGQ